MSNNEIVDWLETHSDDVTEGHYMKPLDSDEVEEYRSAFINDSIQLEANQEELKEGVKSFKAQKLQHCKKRSITPEAFSKRVRLPKTGVCTQSKILTRMYCTCTM